ncbi:meiosis-specific protein MEI4 isoform X2 [Lingula anatina]|uniref:Meiosis-specific protein MEI4 isoform X2 n=1 Tax=Lingula anatina TaxID=7574 RepID=A0A1S3JCI4_LINAN|nr:meiosis-specific protein MEI4 isoform X2 [Lingula anatina]|eukprot:XP_013408038.1 meiosis-specific protein MEI4 isoform X2 [Lingula anatina]
MSTAEKKESCSDGLVSSENAKKLTTLPISESNHVVKSYIDRCRIAAALAIIRSKPQGVTGQQFAKQLCSFHQRQLLDWQKRVHDLEAEFLKVKQDQLMERMKIAQEEAEGNLMPTPPSSSGGEHTQNLNKAEETIVQYSQFLRSIIQLKHYKERTDISQDPESKLTVEKSILKCMDMIVAHMPSGDRNSMVSSNILEQSVSTLVSVLDSRPLEDWSSTIVQGLQHTLGELVRRMVDQDNFHQNNKPEQTSSLLFLFGKSKHFKFTVVECFFTELHFFSEHLRQVCYSHAPLQVKQYENMYFVFKVCEEILNLECWVDKNCHHGIMDRLNLQSMQEILTNCLLHISEEFPLFAHYVWRLGALIDSISATQS